MKICRMCLKDKDDGEFGKNSKRKDQLNSYCKECCGKSAKKRREENPEEWEKQKDKNRKNYRLQKGIDLSVDPRYRNERGAPRLNWGGYVEMKGNKWKGHPCADKDGRILMHRLVMYEKIGRPLESHETIHHKNGNTSDNRIENLELWSCKHPPGYRVSDQICWAKEFLEQYGYEVKNTDNSLP